MIDLERFTERFIDDITVVQERDPETRIEEVQVSRYITKVADDPKENDYWAGGVRIQLPNENLESLIEDAIKRLKTVPLPGAVESLNRGHDDN